MKKPPVLNYFKSLINSKTQDDSRSFSLVLSSIVGALIGLTICFCLVFDTYKNGYIKTDLNELAWFLLSVGCFMFGGGVSDVIADRNTKRYSRNDCSNSTESGNKK